MSLVIHEKLSPKIEIIKLNDPDNLNAMGEEMAREFYETIVRIEKSEQKPRVIILTGSGKAFSAGGNLNMLEAKSKQSPDENRKIMLNFYSSFLSILNLNIPLIAMINGAAVGAGLCVACACDMRVCAKGSKLGFTFTKLGLHPGMGATYFLPKILGSAKANELLLTARIIESEEALACGLVNKVVEGEKLLSETVLMAEQICDSGPESISALLKSLRSPKADLESSLQHEALRQSFSYASAEFAEGVRAAIEKRKPKY